MFKVMIGAATLLVIFMLTVATTFALAAHTSVEFAKKNETAQKYEVNQKVQLALSMFHDCFIEEE